ncbi:MAG TPA: penicillin acylase family protein [Kofleriaceae bacterium]
MIGARTVLSVFRRYPLASRLVVWILLPLLGATLYANHWLRSTLPLTAGSTRVSGLSAPATIARDVHGVPTIEASSDTDAFFGLGFAHGQDRLWQLELQRRIASGRLSEIFGREAVPEDVYLRTLGLGDAARASWSSLGKDAQSSLEAYSKGVNAAIAAQRRLPVEFEVLGVRPEPWTPSDSLAIMKLFALDLSGNHQLELQRLFARTLTTPERLRELFQVDSAGAPTSTRPGGAASGAAGVRPAGAASVTPSRAQSAALASLLDVERQLSLGGRYVGSNAWVVSGRHTASGKPILANDPHLGLQIPSIWYAVRLRGDRLRVDGMSLPGVPVVVLGRNDRIAWGATSMMADTQDLYLEQVDIADPGRYHHGDQVRPFETRTEVIRIQSDFPSALSKPLQPVQIRVRTSMHGPVISDISPAMKQTIALRWVGLDRDDTSYQAFLRLNYARDWSEFRAALGGLVAPALNMLYADVDGNIGYLGAGRIPVRGAGQGADPGAGWDPAFDWTGYIPADALPQAFNPAQGFIVSANNKPVGDDYPYFISSDWAPPGRAERIGALLRERISTGKPLAARDMGAIQTDTLDLQGRALLPVLLAVEPGSARQTEAIARLKGWDGDMARDGVAASIFHAWVRHLKLELFSEALTPGWQDRAQADQVNAVINAVDPAQLARIVGTPTDPWCADAGGKPSDRCKRALRASLAAALRELEKLADSHDMDDWRWGRIHRAAYIHKPFGQFRMLDRLFNCRVETGGSTNTVNVATATYNENKGYLQYFGATMRQIMELGAQGAPHLYMNSTGQSGNVVDSHYDDMIQPFARGEYLDLSSAGAGPAATLRLEPSTP